jgi:hypothetical protein
MLRRVHFSSFGNDNRSAKSAYIWVRFESSRFLENCQFVKSMLQCDNDPESDDLSYGKVTGYEKVTGRFEIFPLWNREKNRSCSVLIRF